MPVISFSTFNIIFLGCYIKYDLNFLTRIKKRNSNLQMINFLIKWINYGGHWKIKIVI